MTGHKLLLNVYQISALGTCNLLPGAHCPLDNKPECNFTYHRYKCRHKRDLKLVHCETKLKGGKIFQTWPLKKMCFFLELLSNVVILFAYKSNSFVTKYQKLLQLALDYNKIFCSCMYHFSLKFYSTLILFDTDF